LCPAKRVDRAEIASWVPRYANERAKIKQCRVEGSCAGFWKKTRCVLPKRFPSGTGIDGFAKIEKPRQNASGVGFDNWDRSIERETGNSVRSVLPDAREPPHPVD
jgi:hypothetical protein